MTSKILQKAYIKGEEVIFEPSSNFEQAFSDGFFLLSIPKNFDLEPGLKLSKSFYKKTQGNQLEYKYFNYTSKKDVYFDREHFQTEHLLLDQHSRKKYFPTNLVEMCNQMNTIGIKVFKFVFNKLSILSKDWDQASGGTIYNKGVQWFACSHYRANLELPGCAAHKDTGFITVLYIDKPGLQAQMNNRWCDINPVKGYFIINFGASLEILVRNLKYPIKAVLHRVRSMKINEFNEDRYSFASFLNPHPETNLFTYDKNKVIKKYMLAKKFLDEFNRNVWHDKHENFGIKTSKESN